jgi:hypothetical protein
MLDVAKVGRGPALAGGPPNEPKLRTIESIFHYNAHNRIVTIHDPKAVKHFPILDAKRAARLFRRNQSCAASWRKVGEPAPRSLAGRPPESARC